MANPLDELDEALVKLALEKGPAAVGFELYRRANISADIPKWQVDEMEYLFMTGVEFMYNTAAVIGSIKDEKDRNAAAQSVVREMVTWREFASAVEESRDSTLQ